MALLQLALTGNSEQPSQSIMLLNEGNMRNDRARHVRMIGCLKQSIWVAGVSALTLMIGPSTVASAAGNYKFQNQVLSLVAASMDVLVRHHLCESRAQCPMTQIVFADSESWGIAMEIYALGDKRIVKELAEIAAAAFFSSATPISVKVKIYSNTKAEALAAPFFARPKPVMELKWENRNADG